MRTAPGDVCPLAGAWRVGRNGGQARAHALASPVRSIRACATRKPGRKEVTPVAKDEARRLKPALVQDGKDVLAALAAMAGYQPSNAAYAPQKLQPAAAVMTAAQDDETQKAAAAKAARDAAVAKEWEFHNLVLGAKDQVIAQFGRDSNEAQAVGLKKKSERKKPTKKPSATAQ